MRGVNDDLLLEILSAWEVWTGSSSDFYKNLGSSHKGMASMIGKAKRLRREGHSMPFEEVTIATPTPTFPKNSIATKPARTEAKILTRLFPITIALITLS